MSTSNQFHALLGRYGPATLDDFHAHPTLNQLSRKAIEKAAARAKQDGTVASHVFTGNAAIYYLTRHGALLAGLNPKRFDRLPSTQGVCESRAMLRFACLSNPAQDRMTAAEFAAEFPDLVARTVCQTRYYVDRSAPDVPRLGVLVPDYNLSTVRDFARKIRRAYSYRIGGDNKHPKHDGWRMWFAERLVQITGITTTKTKADRVRDALRNEPFRVVIVAIPELAELLPRRSGS